MQNRINIKKTKQKQWETEMKSGEKRVISHTLGINSQQSLQGLWADRRFKKTTTSLHDSYIDLSEKNEVV